MNMKFLPPNMEGKKLMPLHVYYSRGDYKTYDDDILDFVYKDMETGKKYVQTINNPMIEVWILKPELRNFSYIPNFMKKKNCICYKVHYKSRYKEVSDILGIPIKDVKISPYVYQIDIKIEHFYLMQFKNEYGNTEAKTPDIGFLDIEADSFRATGPVTPGRDMINCVSYMDQRTMTMNTLVLRKDDIPDVAPNHPKYHAYTELRNKYYEQVDYFIDHINDFIAELHADFDEFYGRLDYHIYMFDREIDLIIQLFKIIKQYDPDIWFVWNLPYDEGSLIKRIEFLGYDPAKIISDEEMQGGCRDFYFRGDNNPKPHKRRHISNIFSKNIPYDQLPLYGGIRVSRGALQSMKLNQIAMTVINDSKLCSDYGGGFKYFNYVEFWKFVKYNIKDVLLQFGIERIGRDAMFLMDSICNDCVLNYEIFTTTITETMSLRDFAFVQRDEVLGQNKNRMELPPPSFSIQDMDGEEYVEDDFTVGEMQDEIDDNSSGDKKKKQYSGAYVMSPAHLSNSGTVIMGTENKYVHKHVIDEDIGAEYPSAICITNCTNDTLFGKVFLLNPSEVEMPFYENFRIVDADDESTYSKIKSSAWMMELYSERDPLCFGERVMGLPSATSILNEINENLKDFI